MGVLVVLGWVAGLHETSPIADRRGLFQLIVILLGLVVAHEGLHYLASRSLGYRPTITFFPPSVVVLDEWGTRRGDIVMLLTPLIVLNLIGAVLWLGWVNTIGDIGAVLVVVNTAVSIGDMYMVAWLARKPPGTQTIVVEHDDGMIEYVAIPSSTG